MATTFPKTNFLESSNNTPNYICPSLVSASDVFSGLIKILLSIYTGFKRVFRLLKNEYNDKDDETNRSKINRNSMLFNGFSLY